MKPWLKIAALALTGAALYILGGVCLEKAKQAYNSK